jgi:hypothetical protein
VDARFSFRQETTLRLAWVIIEGLVSSTVLAGRIMLVMYKSVAPAVKVAPSLRQRLRRIADHRSARHRDRRV